MKAHRRSRFVIGDLVRVGRLGCAGFGAIDDDTRGPGLAGLCYGSAEYDLEYDLIELDDFDGGTNGGALGGGCGIARDEQYCGSGWAGLP